MMAAQRTVFVLNIDKGSDSEGLFESMYDPLMKEFKKNPLLSVTTIDSVTTFQTKISGSNWKESVLLCVNEFITKKPSLHQIIKEFAMGGGLVIFGCLFSSFTTPVDIDAMFENLGVPWKNADYYRTTFGITEMGKMLLHGLDVEETYSAKALQLSQVLPEQMLYKPVENAKTQSLVFAQAPANPNLALAAFMKIGSGAIAYIGDVNAERGSDRLTVALCLAKW
ncbi:uncharacterized protein LOC119080092 [Bradysia coprophila]|uniref:uncharacterized protein LOC119080092 n=1 Tax=Bradysia coprophila TaxID=38358 RepID=UPI00187DC83F|nr:uncharacterized protein LOC119080092 [Bradysia coprophila]